MSRARVTPAAEVGTCADLFGCVRWTLWREGRTRRSTVALLAFGAIGIAEGRIIAALDPATWVATACVCGVLLGWVAVLGASLHLAVGLWRYRRAYPWDADGIVRRLEATDGR